MIRIRKWNREGRKGEKRSKGTKGGGGRGDGRAQRKSMRIWEIFRMESRARLSGLGGETARKGGKIKGKIIKKRKERR